MRSFGGVGLVVEGAPGLTVAISGRQAALGCGAKEGRQSSFARLSWHQALEKELKDVAYDQEEIQSSFEISRDERDRLEALRVYPRSQTDHNP